MRRMLCRLAVAAALLGAASLSPAEDFAISDGDTVGFLGDSITAYRLTADGRDIGTFTAQRLSGAVDIASTTPDPWRPGGPWDAQAGVLKSLTEARHHLQQAVRQAGAYSQGDAPAAPFAEEFRQANDQIEQLQRHSARPRPYRFELARLDDQTTITAPLEYQVFQRATADSGPVRVQGTTTLDIDQVQVQVRGKPARSALPEGWQAVEFTPDGGAFSSSLRIPAGGWYAMDLRFLKAGQSVQEHTIERFGVGEVFVGAGQSNSTNSGQFKTQQTSGMVAAFGGERWQLADDPVPGVADKSQGGSYYPAFGDRLYEIYKVPIGIASTGFGGTSVNQWQPPEGLFAWMMTRIDQLGPHGFRAVLWHQGESDVGMTSDEYYEKLKKVIVTSREKSGWEIPWFVAQVSYHNPDRPSFETTRSAQARLWADGIALEGPDTDTLTGEHRDFDGKGIHFSPKGLKTHGLMWAGKVQPFIDKSLAEDTQPRAAVDEELPPMPRVRISDDGSHFVRGDEGARFVPWGFNYLGEFGKLVEESWDTDWDRVERDFRQMQALGGNVVRVHLQFGTFMTGPDEFDPAQLGRLRKMLDLARRTGLYLDVTGLNCFRLEKIPKWYDELNEAARWDVQARWWQEIARTCAGHPALFCYDLVNEPIIGGPAKEGEPRWVGGELGGFYFVQRITDTPGERSQVEIARAWSEKLTTAIRREDPDTPITVGVIPWAHVWPTAKPVFYAPEVLEFYDFVSIHLYPEKGAVEKALMALDAYDLGKPLVVEETFPLNCTLEEMDRFVEGGRDRVDGWISHYFGYSLEEHRRGAEPNGVSPEAPFLVVVADFLEYWRDKGAEITR